MPSMKGESFHRVRTQISHPLGSPWINMSLVEFINGKFSVLLNDSLLDLNENNNHQGIDDDGFTIDSSDMSELQQEYAVPELNEVFSLKPVIP